jgi:hypothetical protein
MERQFECQKEGRIDKGQSLRIIFSLVSSSVCLKARLLCVIELVRQARCIKQAPVQTQRLSDLMGKPILEADQIYCHQLLLFSLVYLTVESFLQLLFLSQSTLQVPQ